MAHRHPAFVWRFYWGPLLQQLLERCRTRINVKSCTTLASSAWWCLSGRHWPDRRPCPQMSRACRHSGVRLPHITACFPATTPLTAPTRVIARRPYRNGDETPLYFSILIVKTIALCALSLAIGTPIMLSGPPYYNTK